jgi:hypothetical protein
MFRNRLVLFCRTLSRLREQPLGLRSLNRQSGGADRAQELVYESEAEGVEGVKPVYAAQVLKRVDARRLQRVHDQGLKRSSLDRSSLESSTIKPFRPASMNPVHPRGVQRSQPQSPYGMERQRLNDLHLRS